MGSTSGKKENTPVAAYLSRVARTCGVVLGIALSVALLAVWQTHTPRWWLAVVAAALFVVDVACLYAPRLPLFARRKYNWQGKLLEATIPLLLALLAPGVTLAALGVARLPQPHTLVPLSAALLLLVLMRLPIIALSLRSPAGMQATGEDVAFQATMPGLAEELLYRGILLTLLDRAFGTPWQLWGAPFGWGLVLTALVFGLIHTATAGPDGKVTIALDAGAGALVVALILGWMRERSGSIWPGVVAHNVFNVLLYLVALLAPIASAVARHPQRRRRQ